MGRNIIKLFKLLAVRWVLLAITIQMVSSRPMEDSKYIVRAPPIFDDEQRYLMEFGYLPKVTESEISNLLAEDQIIDALRKLQKMGNIPVTGRMDAATKQLMRNPRCGVSDNTENENHRSKRYSLQGHKWNHLDIKWSLRTRHLNNIKHGLVRKDLHRAFKIWAKHSNLKFSETNSDTADILILFAKGPHEDGNPFDGPGRILAHAFFPGEGRGGDVHFDEEEEWLLDYENTKTGTDLFTVAVHEIGHALGLFHSSDINSLMYPWYKNLEHDFELPHDDRMAIQILYGPKNGRLWSDYTPYTPNTHVATPRYTTPMTRISTTSKTTTTSTTTTTTTPASTTTTFTTSSTRPPRRPHVEDNKPYFCDTSFDAVSVIRKETYFFKGKYVWRFNRDGRMSNGYPALIEQMWSKLANVKTVDAVYERKDGDIVFFVGRYYYKFNGRDLLEGYPKPLTELGLPEELDHVDAVTIWGFSNQTYIFSGNFYWKYDENYDKIKELDYPRDMSIWKGVDYNIDAAFRALNGTTYFFKGRGFWKFNDGWMSVVDRRPRPNGLFWTNCTEGGTTSRRERLLTSAPDVASAASAYRSADRLLLALVLLTLAVVCGRSPPSGTVPATPSGGTTAPIRRPRCRESRPYRAASSSDDRPKYLRARDACRRQPLLL